MMNEEKKMDDERPTTVRSESAFSGTSNDTVQRSENLSFESHSVNGTNDSIGLFEVLGDERISKIAAMARYKRIKANVWWYYLAYKKTVSLHERGFGDKSILTRIRRLYPCPLDTVILEDWIAGRSGPADWGLLPATPSTVYLLAAGVGDGCAKYGTGRPFVHFQHLKDRDFADTLASYSKSWVTTDRLRGYSVTVSDPILTDLVNAGKLETMLIYPILRLHKPMAVKGYFDAEGGVDPTHGVPRAFNTNKGMIDVFSRLLGELSIHHTLTLTRMNPLMVVRGNTYTRRKLLKYGISVSSCCMARYDALVSFSIGRKATMLKTKVQQRAAKQLASCPVSS